MQATSGAGSWMAGFGLPGTMQLPDLLQALHGQTIAEFLSSINMEYTPAQGEGQSTSNVIICYDLYSFL